MPQSGACTNELQCAFTEVWSTDCVRCVLSLEYRKYRYLLEYRVRYINIFRIRKYIIIEWLSSTKLTQILKYKSDWNLIHMQGPAYYIFRSDCSYSLVPASAGGSPLLPPSFFLSRIEEPAKAGTCACDRRALQQLALNVHIKHSDLTWPDLTGPVQWWFQNTALKPMSTNQNVAARDLKKYSDCCRSEFVGLREHSESCRKHQPKMLNVV